jgi:hypothetical protein
VCAILGPVDTLAIDESNYSWITTESPDHAEITSILLESLKKAGDTVFGKVVNQGLEAEVWVFC